MTPASELQLEALRLLQEWGMWQITLLSGFSWALLSILNKTEKTKKILTCAKRCLIFTMATIACAVVLVGAVPAQVQHIDCKMKDHCILWGLTTARGIYGLCYLGLIPVWVITSIQRICCLTALGLGLRLLWISYLTRKT